MSPEKIKKILIDIEKGKIKAQDAFKELEKLPFSDLGHTVLDTHRYLRKGLPEVVFGEGKTFEQLVSIANELCKMGQNVLITRVSEQMGHRMCKEFSSMEYHPEARCLVVQNEEVAILASGTILVVSAGTSDSKIAAEAALMASLGGNEVQRINDVGVAGLHRLLNRLDDLRRASVIIVVAGMEGALPSVVSGLVCVPVIAVPTSVGYGTSFGGVTALLGMLNSCSSGVTVVNIDNGFGAGYCASLMNRIPNSQKVF
jgi:pyridinium-3,5-biscarboxylic acid mononucleotide synthase